MRKRIETLRLQIDLLSSQNLSESLQLNQASGIHSQHLGQTAQLEVQIRLHSKYIVSPTNATYTRFWIYLDLNVLHDEQVPERVSILALVDQQIDNTCVFLHRLFAEGTHPKALLLIESRVPPEMVWLKKTAVPSKNPLPLVTCELFELTGDIN
eukprot:CAMPEP_0115675372 /NCGR_PEP_ID=MMETSP0272-20121206/54117_1 /TAXON_ID=71861 /ORGANISM="Scrippsiella trochoidea, Strain CCMP3099" /LENGTH=153 /DNA_ID=CAMNT_0003114339 /DNA_START=629 /DNA_END=1090 /DNA_ORIENTATION=-